MIDLPNDCFIDIFLFSSSSALLNCAPALDTGGVVGGGGGGASPTGASAGAFGAFGFLKTFKIDPIYSFR